jgi:hypothetical protein
VKTQEQIELEEEEKLEREINEKAREIDEKARKLAQIK